MDRLPERRERERPVVDPRGRRTDLDRQLWELERQLGELRLRAENDQENVEYEADGSEAGDVFLDRAPPSRTS
ncbi:unnamed protein product [Ranitomeya imitator]|uniref:Uncharacterized protein n=1 Tax=Ranitomeya imitator TaxID=111125 RepID=A0ABN9KUB8_9NEOB|nr:unnamed protein product [Ranitomeya imitator]